MASISLSLTSLAVSSCRGLYIKLANAADSSALQSATCMQYIRLLTSSSASSSVGQGRQLRTPLSSIRSAQQAAESCTVRHITAGVLELLASNQQRTAQRAEHSLTLVDKAGWDYLLTVA
jgi:hypothetical protein